MGRDTEFINKRGRLQRLSDLKLFAGWCVAIQGNTCSIQLEPDSPDVVSGDKFGVEVVGETSRGIFRALVNRVVGDLLICQIDGPITFATTHEEARNHVEGLVGHFYLDDEDLACAIVDLSHHGMGAQTRSPILRGAMVKFKFNTPAGEIKGEAEVRYCRKMKSVPEQFRIGLHICSMPRLETARWNSLLNGNSKAA